MIFLALAIFASGILPVIFRAFDSWRVNVFWAIPANYIICVFVGSLLTGESLTPSALLSKPWVLFAALQGLILAVSFYLLAHTAQRVGRSPRSQTDCRWQFPRCSRFRYTAIR